MQDKPKKYGFENILRPTIAELTHLEENGIVIEVNSKQQKVYFSLCLLLGDNKALNELMGLTQCFIKNGFCRMCSFSVEESQTMITENLSKLRTVENYAEELAKNDFKNTGIREECIFNRLPTFNIINCPSVDIMHDLFEGVCQFQMTKIILYFIENGHFTLDDLNNRKSLFDFGVYQIDNKKVDVKTQYVKSGKLKMSASQGLCFTRYFSMIIGDLVPRNNKIWDLYKTLLNIIDLLIQNSLNQIEIEKLNELVKKNHTLYMHLFNVNLKPKHHFMVHYASLIQKIGPLKNVYVMKQEMYHRKLICMVKVTMHG